MFYREAGQFKTTYAADHGDLSDPPGPHRPGADPRSSPSSHSCRCGDHFLLNAVMMPFLIFSLAAIGLNLLTGYTGLLSLGTGGFMGVGAYRLLQADHLSSRRSTSSSGFSWSGLAAALVGILFGLPSLRIKGFYLAVATLAAQFFLDWCFVRVPWLVQRQRLRRHRSADADAVRPCRSPARPPRR